MMTSSGSPFRSDVKMMMEDPIRGFPGFEFPEFGIRRVNAIDVLARAATREPWVGGAVTTYGPPAHGDQDARVVSIYMVIPGDAKDADRDFCAAARSEVPFLCRALRGALEEIGDLRQELRGLRAKMRR